MYNVWAISRELYDSLYTTPINSTDREALALLALTHDLAEVVTGDLPSPLKSQIGKTAEYIAAEEEAMNLIGPELLKVRRGCRGTILEAILKLADLIDAWCFLSRHGTGDEHSSLVLTELNLKIGDVRAEIVSGKYLIHDPVSFQNKVSELLIVK